MNEKIKSILLKVDKPSRYCGGEFNTPLIKKDAPLKFLMCFPDVYEVAHSNLGIKILYGILNNRPDTACESCYTPWVDMGQTLKNEGTELFSIETNSPVKSFDIVGFSLQYELSYTNVLYMLDLSGIPLYSASRSESDPVIIGGGPCAINPEPVAEFFDLFCIGDGEEVTEKICDLYLENKKNGGTRTGFLKAAAQLDGVYVPLFKKKEVRRAILKNLDKAYYPTKVQIPNTEAVHNRAVLEIFRGCTRGCRFCQAGMIYRPVRERKVDTLVKYAGELIKNNGFEEISFSSLSTCDYPYLKELLTAVKPLTDKAKVNISLPSTRVDSFEADFVDSARKSSLTFAPEAGTQRLRDVINKNVTEEDILNSCKSAFEKGYSSIKLYFMIGLPTETQEDLEGIIDLASKIKRQYKQYSSVKKPLALSVSTSTFVPKPFTPFQWERQISLEEIAAAQSFLREKLRALSVKYNWHDAKTSRIETTFARGGRELAKVIETAYKSGCVFDGWSEFFSYDKWVSAFESQGIDINEYTCGQNIDKELPWSFINAGVSLDFLKKELQNALAGKTTPDCRGGCKNCGITAIAKGVCP